LYTTCVIPKHDLPHKKKAGFLILLDSKKWFNMKKITSTLASLSPLSILAHPGHGGHEDGGYTIIHYFSQPAHAVPVLVVLAITVMVIRSLRKKNQSA
jgi:hypothetical protein